MAARAGRAPGHVHRRMALQHALSALSQSVGPATRPEPSPAPPRPGAVCRVRARRQPERHAPRPRRPPGSPLACIVGRAPLLGALPPMGPARTRENRCRGHRLPHPRRGADAAHPLSLEVQAARDGDPDLLGFVVTHCAARSVEHQRSLEADGLPRRVLDDLRGPIPTCEEAAVWVGWRPRSTRPATSGSPPAESSTPNRARAGLIAAGWLPGAEHTFIRSRGHAWRERGAPGRWRGGGRWLGYGRGGAGGDRRARRRWG